MSPHPDPKSKTTESPRAAAGSSRRQFIREVGGVLFAVTIVDVADPSFLSGPVYAQSSGCGNGTPDGSCSATTPDSNCGYTTSGAIDPDEGCRGSPYDADQSCGQISRDVDQACSSTDEDQNCNKPYSTPGLTDLDNSCTSTSLDESCGGNTTDESCSTTSTDENCSVARNPPANDVDQSCTGSGAETDEGCGDCDDNHDTDQHCGQPVKGALDPDDLCGHQSFFGWYDSDDVCGATVADQGCGVHKGPYTTVTKDDADGHCGVGGAADMNCTTKASDANCAAATNPSTTAPDEQCSGTDEDGACNHYDRDESCGGGGLPGGADLSDQACGTYGAIGSADPDGHCAPPGDPDDSGNPNTTF